MYLYVVPVGNNQKKTSRCITLPQMEHYCWGSLLCLSQVKHFILETALWALWSKALLNGEYFQLIETKFLGFPPRRRPVSPLCVLGTEARPGWGKAHWKVTIGASTWRSEKRHKLSSKHSWTFTMPGKVGGCMVNQNYGETKTHPPVPPP